MDPIDNGWYTRYNTIRATVYNGVPRMDRRPRTFQRHDATYARCCRNPYYTSAVYKISANTSAVS